MNVIESFYQQYHPLSADNKWDELIDAGLNALNKAEWHRRPDHQIKVSLFMATACLQKNNFTMARDFTHYAVNYLDSITDPVLTKQTHFIAMIVYSILKDTKIPDFLAKDYETRVEVHLEAASDLAENNAYFRHGQSYFEARKFDCANECYKKATHKFMLGNF